MTPTPSAELVFEVDDLYPFDPQGNDQEHGGDLQYLVDGTAETDWRTETYASEDFGGEKDGVGFVIDLREEATVEAVLLDVSTEGFGVELRTADELPDALEDTTQVVPPQVAGSTVELRPEQPLTARYLLVWLTGPLPESGGDPYPYRASISEVDVLGTPGAPAA